MRWQAISPPRSISYALLSALDHSRRSANSGLFPICQTGVILRLMVSRVFPSAVRNSRFLAALVAITVVCPAGYFYLYGQDKTQFPDGFDALQAAPMSHKLIFENAYVRVLEVDVPPPGSTIPMHHHRWPSLVLDWDTGGGTPHIHYLRPGQPMCDVPATGGQSHPGSWSVHWMQPEPTHSIEVVAFPKDHGAHLNDPASLRIEIKCHP